eukprot:1693361-Rhodomonas_salina.6
MGGREFGWCVGEERRGDKTRQDTTKPRPDPTRHDKTRKDTTRQDYDTIRQSRSARDLEVQVHTAVPSAHLGVMPRSNRVFEAHDRHVGVVDDDLVALYSPNQYQK